MPQVGVFPHDLPFEDASRHPSVVARRAIGSRKIIKLTKSLHLAWIVFLLASISGTFLLAVRLPNATFWPRAAILEPISNPPPVQGTFVPSPVNSFTHLIEKDMTLSNISVAGRTLTPSADILAALGPVEGMPLFDLDPEALKKNLEALPWVETVRVERRLPDRLHLILTERRPMALWKHEGKFFVVDTAQHVIDVDPSAWSGHLPYVIGTGAPSATPDLLNMLNTYPPLATRVIAASYVGERRWTLHLDSFDDGLTVLLPETDPAGALNNLIALDERDALLSRDLAVVDMRLPGRIVVRLRQQIPPPTTKGPSSDRTLPPNRSLDLPAGLEQDT